MQRNPTDLRENVTAPAPKGMAGESGSISPGDEVGHYVIEEALGSGGMGVVFAARHEALGHRVAMKFISARASADAETFVRFSREAKIIASLESDHVVRVIDFGTHAGVPYMVMDLLAGRDLGREARAIRGARRLRRSGLRDPSVRWALGSPREGDRPSRREARQPLSGDAHRGRADRQSARLRRLQTSSGWARRRQSDAYGHDDRLASLYVPRTDPRAARRRRARRCLVARHRAPQALNGESAVLGPERERSLRGDRSGSRGGVALSSLGSARRARGGRPLLPRETPGASVCERRGVGARFDAICVRKREARRGAALGSRNRGRPT